MNKLEKIASIVCFVAGASLFSYGLYKNKPLLTGLGLVSGACSAGLILREMVEEDDERYYQSYPR